MERFYYDLFRPSDFSTGSGPICFGIAVAVCVLVSVTSNGIADERCRSAVVNSTTTKSAGTPQQRTPTNKPRSKTTPTASHPLTEPLRTVRQSLAKLDDVKDYTATFSKKERLVQRRTKLLSQTIKVKVRQEPFSLYLNYQDRRERGREVLYVDGDNRGNMLVVEGPRLNNWVIALAPNDDGVMKESRYPITEFGLKSMAERIIEQWEAESNYGDITVKHYENAKLGDKECLAIESSHPQPQRQFKFHMTRVFIDKRSRLLVRVEQYGWPTESGQPPPIIEQYSYSEISTNVGLTDYDFDRDNASYHF